MAFSIKKTLSELLRVEQGDGDLQCINGIRALCTMLLYVLHKFFSMAFMPYSNRINFAQVKGGFGNKINLCPDQGLNPGPPAQKSDNLPLDQQLNLLPVSMLVRAFAIYVYAFLLLSGVLTAYNMSREMKRKGYVDWKRRYLARFIR
uniref:Uncharacterized protein n=1 Tax=Timema bartmani TaxID=61472 RepID=A0A7R9I775_9NEOP|nr:unnamed protein product [Timema bartmani]